MSYFELISKANGYLEHLCKDYNGRPVGSKSNIEASEFISGIFASTGGKVEKQNFACFNWEASGVKLSLGNTAIKAFPSPFSLSCNAEAPFSVLTSLADLEEKDIQDRFVLLCKELVKEQFIPKNFPFYNPADQKYIIKLLEEKKPVGIIARSPKKIKMNASGCLLPLFEDGDFDIPSVYISEKDTLKLVEFNDKKINLQYTSKRIPANAYNIINKKGNGAGKRIILMAHADTKFGTPGTTDNACSVVVLLLLAEMLSNYNGKFSIEFTIINGEENYANPGEMLFLSDNANSFTNILLGINLDGLGYKYGDTAYSLYGCPSNIAQAAASVFSSCKCLIQGYPWFQSDHCMLIQNNIPAIALTAQQMPELVNTVFHSPMDTPEVADTSKLVKLAYCLRDLLLYLDRTIITGKR
jgi:aminopeptidase YwaD